MISPLRTVSSRIRRPYYFRQGLRKHEEKETQASLARVSRGLLDIACIHGELNEKRRKFEVFRIEPETAFVVLLYHPLHDEQAKSGKCF